MTTITMSHINGKNLAFSPKQKSFKTSFSVMIIAKRLRAKFWPDCAIPDTSMKLGTVVDHD